MDFAPWKVEKNVRALHVTYFCDTFGGKIVAWMKDFDDFARERVQPP